MTTGIRTGLGAGERAEQDMHKMSGIHKRRKVDGAEPERASAEYRLRRDKLAAEILNQPTTDAEMASALRASVGKVSDLMNLAKQRGLTVNFNINETDGVFKESVDVRRINVEVF